MTCYKAAPVSRADIRGYVRYLKKEIGLENSLYFPVIEFLEHVLPLLFDDFQLEIIPVSEMRSGIYGETFPSQNLIRLREDVYEGAVSGNGRDRFTVAHEIGHLFMHEGCHVALCRLAPGEKLKAYENPEWQANTFAGELLASSHLLKGLSAREVSQQCGISASAARVQLGTMYR